MSDIPPGGPPPPGGEVNISGTSTYRPQGRGTFLQRRFFGRQGITSTVQASLKFDIPGLKDFRTELEGIKKALDSLDASFKKISTSPMAWAKNLRAANDELRAMNANSQGMFGGSSTAPGAPIPVSAVGAGGSAPGGPRIGSLISAGRAAAGARAGGAGMAGTAAAGIGGAGLTMGASAIGGMVASAVTSAMTSLMASFEKTMDKTMQADIYASRMAGMTGVTAQQQFSAQGRKGGIPFYAGFTEANQVIYQGGMLGAPFGASGLAGQRGQAYTTSVMQLQNLMPGMSGTQAGSVVSQGMQNIQGMKQAAAGIFGSAALIYKPGGKLKTQTEYYGGILKRLESMPRGPRSRKAPGTPWTREEIEGQMFPGSIVNTWLDSLGFTPDMKEAFWNYAVSRSQSDSGDAFAATRRQMEDIRGPSVATAGQALERRRGQQDAAEGGRQYDNQLRRLQHEEQMIWLLQKIDEKLSGIKGLLGEVPGPLQGITKKGGAIVGGIAGGAAVGAGLGLLGGPFAPITVTGGAIAGGIAGGIAGLFGDPGPEGGLSHLSPDLRQRVGMMMQMNPNLRISSAYRDNLRQQRLQGKGPFAPSGKSKHGRGMAVDIGPASQLGWLNANASKFGLGTAAHMGEPWHVQLAGSMGFMGDPTDNSVRGMLERSQERWLTALTAAAQQQQAAAAAAATGTTTTPAATPTDPAAASPQPGAATPGSQSDLARAQDLKARKIQPSLQTISPSGKMDMIAANSFAKVTAAFGHPIGNVGTFRSFEEQARHCDASGHGPDCGRFAPAGKSLHEVGLAIDVINSVTGGLDNPALVNAFTNAGWFRRGAIINGRNEPWHWTYMVPGDPGYMPLGDPCTCQMGDLPDNATADRIRQAMAAGEKRWMAALQVGASSIAGAAASSSVNLSALGASTTGATGGTVTPVAPGGVGGSGVQDPHNIFTYLRQNAVSQASSAGILANIQYESGFNPSIIGDHGTSGGLFQHHAGRWTALKNYAASTNRPWTDWKAQVEYALQEARTPSYGINLNATDPKAAASEWALKFEKMSGGASSAATRANAAPQYMYAGDPAVDYDGYMGTMSGIGAARPPVRIANGGSGGGVSFNNTFHITLSGTPPSRDIDAAVKQIASRLEVQMRRQVSRSN